METSPAKSQPPTGSATAVSEVISVGDEEMPSEPVSEEAKHGESRPDICIMNQGPLQEPDDVASITTVLAAAPKGNRHLRERPHIRRAPSGMIASSLIEFIDLDSDSVT